jgi:hypothetical protein
LSIKIDDEARRRLNFVSYLSALIGTPFGAKWDQRYCLNCGVQFALGDPEHEGHKTDYDRIEELGGWDGIKKHLETVP